MLKLHQVINRAAPLFAVFNFILQDSPNKLVGAIFATGAAQCLDGSGSMLTNALCSIALSWRIYLFAGADSGGEPAATRYGLITMVKLKGIAPKGKRRLSTVLRHQMEQDDAYHTAGKRRSAG
jgi:hypothetical protein